MDQYYPNTEKFTSGAEQRGPLWKIVLSSPNDTTDYYSALLDLIYSKAERNHLYELKETTEIDRMLDVLYLESGATTSILQANSQQNAFAVLKKMCKVHRRWPSSLVIRDEVDFEQPSPYDPAVCGTVRKGLYDGKVVAVRILWSQDGNGTGRANRAKEQLYHGTLAWKLLSHPNLIPFLGVNETKSGPTLICDWMGHGTILQFVENNQETNRLKLLHDVASGLEYLHKFPVVHSNLKSEVILIDSGSNARIGDFGLGYLAFDLSKSIGSVLGESIIGWKSPELLGGGRRSTLESDVYTFGIVAYEVFAGPLVRKRKRNTLAYNKVIRQLIDENGPLRPPQGERIGLDDEVWNKIQECFNLEPEYRPTMKDVRSFLEPLHQKWLPPAPEDDIPSHDEKNSYVDFTGYSEGTFPSHVRSATGASLGDTLMASEELPGDAPLLEASARTREWVIALQSNPSPKILRPGVTFKAEPTIFDIAPPSPSGETVVPTNHWAQLFPEAMLGDSFELFDVRIDLDIDPFAGQDPLQAFHDLDQERC